MTLNRFLAEKISNKWMYRSQGSVNNLFSRYKTSKLASVEILKIVKTLSDSVVSEYNAHKKKQSYCRGYYFRKMFISKVLKIVVHISFKLILK